VSTIRQSPALVVPSERIAHAMLLAQRRDDASAARRAARRRFWRRVLSSFSTGRERVHGGSHG